jgi:hypothetical protein
MRYLTTQEIADVYRVTPGRIRQLAVLRGIAGEKRGNTMLYRAGLLGKFKPQKAGRPLAKKERKSDH